MRDTAIRTFYNPAQVLDARINESQSRSPQKPRLLVEQLERSPLAGHLSLDSEFVPFAPAEFRIAHTQRYVDAFFAGKEPLCSTNGIPWSQELARTVRYTNSSLYHAILASIENPEQISFSPTSGFHHAVPARGNGFCSFSGQVIASVRLLRERGLSGAYLDLDAHYGNSIEDSRFFVPDLNLAVPDGCNINPDGTHAGYVQDFSANLRRLGELIQAGKIHYVVFCHGADSHEADDLGHGQCTTAEWLECSRMFYSWVRDVDSARGTPLPVTLTLFGGYRKTNYQAVLDLHKADIAECVRILVKGE